jgi:hypothetical protein
MVDQAQVTTNGPSESPPRAAARNFAELLHDVLALAELQGQLVAVEARDEIKKTIGPTITMACGAVLVLSCLPLALVCAALFLDELTQLSMAQSFLVTLLVGVVVSVALILGSVWYLRRNISLLERSRTEWASNVRWVRGVLKRLAKSGMQARFGAETGYRW